MIWVPRVHGRSAIVDMVRGLGRSQRLRLISQAAVVVVSAIVVGCSPRVGVHGNSPDTSMILEIVPGTHTRLDVQQILGSPSSVSLYGEEIWFYIGDRIETLAFLEPDVTERQVVQVRFGPDGVVESVDSFGKERSREIEIVERTTPTRGNEITIVDQILGNIGRFEE